MTFDSISFLFFLSITWSGYWLLHKNCRAQNALLLLASYLFYGWWDARFCLLLALCSLISFAAGLLLASAKKLPRRLYLLTSITLLISILALFKYYNFFLTSTISILHSFGFNAHLPLLKLILPIGLSFYTFQSIGYILDVSRGTIHSACKTTGTEPTPFTLAVP